MYNLKKAYLQRRNGDADIENGLVDTAGEEEEGRLEEAALTCTHHRL